MCKAPASELYWSSHRPQRMHLYLFQRPPRLVFVMGLQHSSIDTHFFFRPPRPPRPRTGYSARQR